MVSEAWAQALAANQEEKEAEDAAAAGESKADFIKDELAKQDGRSIAQKLAAAAKAWAEALAKVNDGLQEEIAKAKEEKAAKAALLEEARAAVLDPTMTQKDFENRKVWRRPTGASPSKIAAAANEAYETAEGMVKAEARTQKELADEREINAEARVAVQQNRPESQWVEQKMASWKAHPDLAAMTEEQETQLREKATFAYN